MSILVTANTRSARAQMAALNRQLAYSVSSASRGSMVLQRGITALKFAAVGSIAAVGGAVAAATQYESAFANVRKTVEATDAQFEKLNKGFIEMSTQIPESASSLAELGGAAGALGIGQKNLLKFTKTAAMLGDTVDDLTAQGAAESLARLGNIMDQSSTKAFERMGSTLVDLGNKGASTEGEIAAMSLRIAGAGKQVDLTTAQVQGMSAGLANLGIRSEMGGSAISRVMLAMQASIAKGGEELKTWAATAGLSVEQFAMAFKKDVPATIATFAEGLNRIKEESGSASLTLAELGKAAHTSMNDIRVRDTLLRVSGNTDEFNRSMKVANEAWRENTALQVEAEKRYQTLASQMELLGNQIVATGIDLGTKLLPDIKEMVSIMKDDDLPLGEKMGEILGKLGDIIKRATPLIVDIFKQIGKGVLDGFYAIWRDANPLTKAALTALVIRVMGGKGAIRAAGAALGTTLTGGMFVGFRGSEAAIAAGARFKAMGSGLGKVAGRAGLAAMATEFLYPGGIEGMFKDLKHKVWAFWFGGDEGAGSSEEFIDFLEEEMGDVAKGLGTAMQGEGVRVRTVLGDLIFDPETEKVVKAKSKALGSYVGKSYAEVMTKLQQQLLSIAREGGETDFMGSLFPEDDPSLDRITRFAQGLGETGDKVAKWTRKHKEAATDVEKAQANYDLVLQHHKKNSVPAIRAEVELAKAMNRTLRSSEALAHAEKLHGAKRRATKSVMEGSLKLQLDELEFKKKNLRALNEELLAADKRGATWQEQEALLELITAATKDVGTTQKDLNKIIGRASEQIGPKFAKQLEELIGKHKDHGKSAKDSGKDVEKANKGVQDSAKKTGKAVGNMADDGVAAWGDFAGAASDGVSFIEKLTGGALRAMGFKAIDFGTQKQRKSFAGSKMRGGLVPGTGTGDSVPLHVGGQHMANVEPGEKIAVVNREAAKAEMEKNRAVPRYAEGGVIGGLQPGISKLASWAGRELGLGISSGKRSGGGGSWHDSGQAVDLVPPSLGATKRIFGSFKSQLEELFYDPWGGFKSGQTIGPIGDHLDHIHAAILGGGAGGAVGGIPRVLMTGPDGALKGIGQGALDKVRGAANKHLASKGGGAHGNIAIAKGPLQAAARKMVTSAWGAGEWGPFSELVQNESGWDPSIINAKSGAAGLAQALPASKYPAGAWPYTGLASAKKQIQWMIGYIQDRYGNPSAALGAWGARSPHWYQEGGILELAAGSGFGPGGVTYNLEQMLAKVKSLGQGIDIQDERIEIADALANEDGEVSVPELAKLSGLNQTLLSKLYGQRSTVNDALGLVGGKLERQEGRDNTAKMSEKITEITHEIARRQKRVEALQKSLKDVGKDGERERLQKELRKAKPKQKPAIEKQLRQLEKSRSDQRENLEHKIEKQQRRIGKLRDERGDLREARDARKDKLSDNIEESKDRQGDLSDILVGLEGVTGEGGRIFDTKLEIRRLGQKPDEETADPDPNFEELLRLQAEKSADLLRALNVSQAQYGVFQGAFAGGGRVPGAGHAIVGERGPEVISTRGGEQITPLGSGSGLRIVIEDHTTRVFVDDKEIDAQIERRMNKTSRSRTYAGAGRLA